MKQNEEVLKTYILYLILGETVVVCNVIRYNHIFFPK